MEGRGGGAQKLTNIRFFTKNKEANLKIDKLRGWMRFYFLFTSHLWDILRL